MKPRTATAVPASLCDLMNGKGKKNPRAARRAMGQIRKVYDAQVAKQHV